MADLRWMHRWREPRLGDDAIRKAVGHRRRVAFLKMILPVTVMVLVAAVFAWPSLTKTTSGFRLDFGLDVGQIGGQGGMVNPRFLGVDSQEQPYTITAAHASHPENDTNRVNLSAPEADLSLKGGDWFFVRADEGVYDRAAESLDLVGDVTMYTDQGVEFRTTRAHVDLTSGTARGDQPVHGQGPWGLIDSVGFTYQRDGGHVLRFLGRPTMILHDRQQDREG